MVVDKWTVVDRGLTRKRTDGEAHGKWVCWLFWSCGHSFDKNKIYIY
jgi:hypothetical protein